VYGPAAIEEYLDTPRDVQDFYLYFGQLAENNRADIAVEACILLNKKLIVAGGGNVKWFQKKYGKHTNIQFEGWVSGERLKTLFRQARALLFPGVEDLGLTPIEANAAGCPVIAYRKGGVLDTVKENRTGIFFDEQNPRALVDAIERFEPVASQFTSRFFFNSHVRQFSRESFKKAVRAAIDRALAAAP
jgi:glycosyltransferase involved in cell wall biosynthesis